MPNQVQTFIIVNGDARPNGRGARMSRSGAGNLPNQAQWQSDEDAYTIGLPTNVWNVEAEGGTFFFELDGNSTSATYALRADAPTGLQTYSIASQGSPKGGDTIPEVDVDP
jgi:hypothetical protein